MKNNKLSNFVKKSLSTGARRVSNQFIDFCIKNTKELIKSKIMIHKSYSSFCGDSYHHIAWIGIVAGCSKIKEIYTDDTCYQKTLPNGLYYTIYNETLIIVTCERSVYNMSGDSAQPINIYIIGKNKFNVLQEMYKYRYNTNIGIVQNNNIIAQGFINDKNGYITKGNITVKPLNEVFINKNEKDKLINFLNKFKNNREFYIQRCI